MNVKDLMSTNFKVGSSSTTLQQAAEMMRDGDFGYLPVVENGKLRGVVTDRDIVVRGLAGGLGLDAGLSEVISEDVVYCFEEDNIFEAAEIMKSEQIRRLAVLNSGKDLVGIVSLGDIARIGRDRKLTGDIETKVSQVA